MRDMKYTHDYAGWLAFIDDNVAVNVEPQYEFDSKEFLDQWLSEPCRAIGGKTPNDIAETHPTQIISLLVSMTGATNS